MYWQFKKIKTDRSKISQYFNLHLLTVKKNVPIYLRFICISYFVNHLFMSINHFWGVVKYWDIKGNILLLVIWITIFFHSLLSFDFTDGIFLLGIKNVYVPELSIFHMWLLNVPKVGRFSSIPDCTKILPSVYQISFLFYFLHLSFFFFWKLVCSMTQRVTSSPTKLPSDQNSIFTSFILYQIPPAFLPSFPISRLCLTPPVISQGSNRCN